jgi:hypothetical protein
LSSIAEIPPFRGHEVDRQEPPRQPGLGLLDDRAREQRMLLTAGRALVDQARPVRAGPVVAAGRTAKSARPAHLEQIGPALLVSPETLQNPGRSPGRSSGKSPGSIASATYASSLPDYLNQPTRANQT